MTDKKRQEKKEKSQETVKMWEWFLQIWDEREDEQGYCYCFESGKKMHRSYYRMLSSVYDHVLEKNDNQYPEYKFVKKNIVIILPEVHYKKGSNIDFTPKIKAYRDELLELHRNGELKD